MKSLLDLYPNVYRLLLPHFVENQDIRNRFDAALSEDHALVIAQASSGISHGELARLDRKIDQLTTTMKLSTHAPPKTSYQQFYEISFGLRGREAQAHINAMKNLSLVKTLEKATAPFNQVKACRVFATKLVLCVSSAATEIAVHEQQQYLGPILGIPALDCFLLRQTYEVQIINLKVRHNGQFADPSQFEKEWSSHNGVTIAAARWTWKKLIWSFHNLGDAQKLVTGNGVTVSGIPAHAVPYDKRSTLKLCHTCGKPGHLKRQCPDAFDPVCLRCGQKESTVGHTAWGNGKTACNQSECCVNCGGPHPAWGPQCQDPKVKLAFKDAQFYAQKKVFWECYPRVCAELVPAPSPSPAESVASGPPSVLKHPVSPAEGDTSSVHDRAAEPVASSCSDYGDAAYDKETLSLLAQSTEESSISAAHSVEGGIMPPASQSVASEDDLDLVIPSFPAAVVTQAAENPSTQLTLEEERYPKSTGMLAEEAAQQTTVRNTVSATTTPISWSLSSPQREPPASAAPTAAFTALPQKDRRKIRLPDYQAFPARPVGPFPQIDKPDVEARPPSEWRIRDSINRTRGGPVTRRPRGAGSGKIKPREAGRDSPIRGSVSTYFAPAGHRNS
ncbi:hypothetical protein J4E91_001758 [Alternaria rosae]|nr:hypothetical protein J4E91_001758 [Alternaria rosae]